MKSLNHKLGKFFSIIKSGYKNNKSFIFIPKTNFYIAILKFLFFEGYINGIFLEENKHNFRKKVKVYLKYYHNKPVFNFVDFNSTKLKLIVKALNFSGKHYYLSGITHYGLVVYNTDEGIKSLQECLVNKKNGQFLFQLK